MLELLVDHRLFPEVSLAVLHPLEVRSGDAAGVAENVGNHEDLFVGQNIVGGGGGGAVGAFRQNLAFDPVGIAAGDLVFGGGGNKDFAIGDQQFGGVLGLGAREPMDGAIALAEFPERLDVDAVSIDAVRRRLRRFR